jgi:hypothetical protein
LIKKRVIKIKKGANKFIFKKSSIYSLVGIIIFTLSTNLVIADDITVKEGRLGIIAQDPKQPLHIEEAGTYRASIRLESNTGSADTWDITSADDSGRAVLAFTDISTSTNGLTLTEDGYVGISSSNPQAKLHVVQNAGNIRMEGTDHVFMEFYPDGPAARKGFIGYDAASNDFMMIQNEIPNEDIILWPTGGNVGIGINNPAQKLDVVGQIHSTDDICTDLNGGKCLSTTVAPGSGDGGWVDDGSNVRLRTDGDMVGIGTLLPLTKLHIVQNADNLRLEGTDHVFMEFYPDGPATRKGFIGYDAASNDFMMIQNEIANEDIILWPTGGNVGIGTTGPGQKLDVVGNVRVSDGNFLELETASNNIRGYIQASETASAAGPGLTISTSNGEIITFKDGGVGGTENMVIEGGGDVGIGTLNPAERLEVIGNILASGVICDMNGCIGDLAADILWAESGTDTFLIQTGNEVGIGTTTPSAKLHVVQNSNTLRIEGTDHTYLEFYPDGPAARKGYFGFAGAADNFITLTNQIAGGDIYLETGVGGGVGIGTTGPAQKLDVIGNIRVSDGNFLELETASNNIRGYLQASESASAAGPGLTIATSGGEHITFKDGGLGGTENMVIKGDGKVGIGTTDPNLLLWVGERDGTPGTGTAGFKSDTNAHALYIQEPSGAAENWQIGLNAAGDLGFFDSESTTASVTFEDGGNVGIGTASPGAKLDVAGGDIEVTGSIYSSDTSNLAVGKDTTDFFDIRDGAIYTQQNGAWEYQMLANDFSPYVHNTNDLGTDAKRWQDFYTIDGFFSGNVGIGNTNPAEKLDVTGNVIASGTVCDVNGCIGGLASSILWTDSGASTYLSQLGDNVGIGNNNPSQKLDVTGQIHASDDVCTDLNGGMCLSSTVSPGSGDSGWIDGGTSVRLATSGDSVAIGTATASYKLDVFGASGNYPARVSSPDGYLVYGPANTGWSHFVTDRPRFYFNTGVTVDSGAIGSYDEDLSLQTSGNTKISVLNSNGNVGIGITNPGSKLDVNGNVNAQTSYSLTSASHKWDMQQSTTKILWEYNDAAKMSINSGGNLIASNSVSTGTPDIAENIIVTDLSIEAGDVVTIDKNFKPAVDSSKYDIVAVKKADSNSDELLGVISENPGILLNVPKGAVNDGILSKENDRPLALAGRIFVKVSLENGPIETGDKLTSSSTPGVAMKAASAGKILGEALEPFTGEGDKILSFINPGYWAPEDINSKLDKLVEMNDKLQIKLSLLEEKNNELENKLNKMAVK